jgi:hypothetical protein
MVFHISLFLVEQRETILKVAQRETNGLHHLSQLVTEFAFISKATMEITMIWVSECYALMDFDERNVLNRNPLSYPHSYAGTSRNVNPAPQ